jgi:hypothetical protein
MKIGSALAPFALLGGCGASGDHSVADAVAEFRHAQSAGADSEELCQAARSVVEKASAQGEDADAALWKVTEQTHCTAARKPAAGRRKTPVKARAPR